MNFESIFRNMWVGAMVCLGFLLGEINVIVQTLCVVVILDYISGILKALYFKCLDSNMSYKGILKKFSYFIVVVLAHWMDTYLGSIDIVRNAVIGLFIGTEGISILENCYAVNHIMPEFLKKILHSLFEKKESLTNKVRLKFL